MKNLKKKGFTIVELVIVIAVIAVLAAVLIPTFVSLTKKANLSADQQMVRNMNTTLAVEGTLEKFENAGDAINALNRNGFTGKYNTYSSGYHYCYSLENNKMYLVDNENNVVYPEENVILSSLWGLYMDDRTSITEGVNKYIALDNINNSQHYVEVFDNGTYTIDLNGHFIAVESNTLNVTVNNGIIINGANVGEGISSDYTIVDSTITGTGHVDLSNYHEEKDNKYVLSKLIFTSDELGASINPHYYKEVVFEDCIFYNVAVSLNDSTPRADASSKFINCKFIDISSSWSIITYSTIEIDNCSFTNLKTRGAIQVQEYNNNINVKITDCYFDGTAADYPLIRFVYGNVKGIKSLEISNCEFSALNKGTGIIGMRDNQTSLYNWTNAEGEATVTFTNNKVNKDINSSKYVVNASNDCKLAELFAASAKN